MGKNMCSDKISNLANAMIRVQKQLRPALKDSFNNFTQSRYATLNSVMEACSEALTDAGIWVTQNPVPVDGDGKLGLVTKLVHAESGEWQESLIVMPLAKCDPQAYGSALTYARRYGLSSMIGLVTEDDDGNMAVRSTTHNSLNQGKLEPPSPHLADLNGNKNCLLSNLPKIDGIEYQEQKAKDGSLYITASGNTRNKNSILKEAGFKWNTSRKIWWVRSSDSLSVNL